MITLEVSGADTSGVFAAQLGKKLPAALARAVNRAIKHGYTQAARRITAETGVQRKYVVPSLSIVQARPDPLEAVAVLQARARRVPLIAYLNTGFRSGRGIGGVAYRAGIAPPHAFFAKFRSGKRVVAERIGRERSRLRVLTGPPIPQVIVERHVYEALRGPVREYYEKRLAHELDRVIQAQGDDAA